MATQSGFPSSSDGTTIATYLWAAEAPAQPRGVVQISHGLAEYGLRYDRLAQALSQAGYKVYANDHRGHGKSVEPPSDLVNFGKAGFGGLVADVAQFGAQIAAQNQGLPLFLIAHSMGSIAAQEVVLDHSALYQGLVLTGTTAVDVFAANLAKAPDADGDAVKPSGLEAFNQGFVHRTGYEWLSRDEAEVDKYVADPLMRVELADETIPALFGSGARLADPKELAGIRSTLPILVTSGEADPLSGKGQLVELVGQRYRDAGVKDVTVTVYPDARHEIFNETNRDEVTADVIAWLDAHV
jgi:alpha-beta hydrolase superfamily lysophospholipase